MPWGAEVPLLGRTVQGGPNFWLQVSYNGKTCWIYAPFVTIRGDARSVPIRSSVGLSRPETTSFITVTLNFTAGRASAFL